MRVEWNFIKNLELKFNSKRGGIGFNEVKELFNSPYVELKKNDNPLQMLAIGWVNTNLYSLVYEFREDDEGELLYFVTF